MPDHGYALESAFAVTASVKSTAIQRAQQTVIADEAGNDKGVDGTSSEKREDFCLVLIGERTTS